MTFKSIDFDAVWQLLRAMY